VGAVARSPENLEGNAGSGVGTARNGDGRLDESDLSIVSIVDVYPRTKSSYRPDCFIAQRVCVFRLEEYGSKGDPL
jgi:hypothetical protein